MNEAVFPIEIILVFRGVTVHFFLKGMENLVGACWKKQLPGLLARIFLKWGVYLVDENKNMRLETEELLVKWNTPLKFNSSPLKSYRDPIGSRIVFLSHHFSGVFTRC